MLKVAFAVGLSFFAVAARAEDAKPMECNESSQPPGGKLPNFESFESDPVPDADLNGWKTLGPPLGETDINNGGPARFYTWTSEDKKISCYILYRKPKDQDGFPGVLCFNNQTCEACAYDGTGKATTIGALERKPDDMTCYTCHRSGSVLLTPKTWKETSKDFAPLSKICTEKGGVTWRNSPKADTPDPKKVVPAPATCAAEGCHAKGFVPISKGNCLVLSALLPGGAMAPRKFESVAKCEEFLKKLGCIDEQIARCSEISDAEPGK